MFALIGGEDMVAGERVTVSDRSYGQVPCKRPALEYVMRGRSPIEMTESRPKSLCQPEELELSGYAGPKASSSPKPSPASA